MEIKNAIEAYEFLLERTFDNEQLEDKLCEKLTELQELLEAVEAGSEQPQPLNYFLYHEIVGVLKSRRQLPPNAQYSLEDE